MQAIKGGVAQEFMSLGKLGTVSISYPVDIGYQEKIVRMLATYDNLIESNQKQIKLLEEAAQCLYKEWFVDLRFSGYEGVTMVDGVPEGWRRGILGDIAIDVGKKEKRENRNKYRYYLPIDCLPKKTLTYTSSNDVEMAESSLVAFKENDILFGAMRPYFHKVVIAKDSGLTRTTCFVINSKDEVMWAYLTMLMFDENTVRHATTISVGTTMPYVRWKDFSNMPIIIPSKDIAFEFQKVFEPIINKIKILSEQNIRLASIRELLLPKLINGEIEV